jgi:hypothetical protein
MLLRVVLFECTFVILVPHLYKHHIHLFLVKVHVYFFAHAQNCLAQVQGIPPMFQ